MKRAVVWVVLAGAAVGVAGVAVAADREAPLRYSHADHQAVGVDQAQCRQCHELKPNLDPAAPGKGANHQPCNDSQCHASEFFAKEPTICVVCHDSAQPWVKQSARLRRAEASEFASDLSHKAHAKALVAGGDSGGANGTCKACHGNPYKGTLAPRGHATCAECHGKSAEPAMGNCGDCHALGADVKRRMPSEWSVARLYDHTEHGRDPRMKSKGETKCQTCHEGVAEADSLAVVVPPTMKSCDGCHDGGHAFKTTGFGCYRCHSRDKGAGVK